MKIERVAYVLLDYSLYRVDISFNLFVVGLVELNRPQEARKIVEEALAQNWDARLLRRYPDTTAGDALPLIQKAEW